MFSHTRVISLCQFGTFLYVTRSHIKHDDRALTLNIITITQPTISLLTSCVPNIKYDRSQVGLELHRINLHTTGRNISLFEFTSHVASHERSLPYATISDQDELELRHF